MQKSQIIQPAAMQAPFATLGDKNIPSYEATGTDTSSIKEGFLPITSEPLDLNGQAPEREDFNGMFYLSTDFRVFQQNGGLITYDATVASTIGGYPKDAILGYLDSDGKIGFVRSLKEDNQVNFVADPTKINNVDWAYTHILNTDADIATINSTINTTRNNLQSQITTNANNISSVSSRTTTAQNRADSAYSLANSKLSSSGFDIESGIGWMKFSNRFLVQWGSNSTPSNSYNRTINLKYAYSATGTYQVFLTDTGSSSDISFQKVTAKNSGKQFVVRSSSYSDDFTWLTIGRAES